MREDRALLPGTEARPADILLPHWTGGRDTALDITVINPLQLAYVNQSATNPGHALRKAYERKMSKHGEPCREAGLSFCPLPVDTLGAWSNTMVEQVKRMGSALARNRGEDDSDVNRHLTQRVAVVLARLNASMLLNRAPQNTPTHIDCIH